MLQINRQLITNTLTRPALRKVNGANYNLREVRAIIAHWTANKNKGAHAMANRNYFNNGSPGPGGTFRSASAHYCVDSNQIVQCLPDNEVGFHIGGARYKSAGMNLMKGYRGLTPNYFAIGFEMCVNSDGDWDKTRSNSVQLAAHLLFKHGLGIDSLLRHYDITGKDCPKMYIDESLWGHFKYLVNLVLQTEYSQYRRAVVSTNDLNVRSGPNATSGVVRVLSKGEPVVIFRTLANGWAEIESNQFVNSKFLI